MRKKVAALLVALLTFGGVGSRLRADDGRIGMFSLLYDLDSAAVIYCNDTGMNGHQANPAPISGDGKLQTSGSSATVTEVTSGSLPFAPLSVGDVIAVQTTQSAVPDYRLVTAKASGASITVDTAVDWSAGYAFGWYKQTCGTASTNGWLDVGGLGDLKVTFTIGQMNATSIDFRVEAQDQVPGAGINVIYPGQSSDCGPDGALVSGYCQFTAAATHSVYIPEPESKIRVGVKINTDDGGDTGANREQINISYTGRVVR